jgi:hypothetical protein
LDVTTTTPAAGWFRAIRVLGKLAAIGTAWVVAVVAVTGLFYANGMAGEEFDWLTYGNLFGFAYTMAVASAAAAIVALVIGGNKGWGLVVLAAVALAVVSLASVAHTLLWLAPLTVRSHMDYWHFEQLRTSVRDSAIDAARFYAPLSAMVGLLAGALAGLLVALARRKPRAAIGLALALLVACASEPVQRLALELIVRWGYILRRLILSWGQAAEQISATGAAVGAIAGAVVAGVALRFAGATRERRLDHGPTPAQPTGQGSRAPGA